jgi:glycine/D-amino acid oxidase-like deaminating enzyme
MQSGQEQKRADACDVVVVGAGLVGAAIAQRLARQGFETAVLDAQQVAGGATGHSAGLVLTGLSGHYSQAISVYGREKAREIWTLTDEGRERLIESAERLGVPVERSGSLMVAQSQKEAGILKESAALLRDDGFDAWFGPNDPLDRGFQAAMRYNDDAIVDPVALTEALLTSEDVMVHPGTEVYSLEADGDRIRVWAQNRTILCSTVVLAVNGYAPLFDAYFTEKVTPTRASIMTADRLRESLDLPCCTDYGYRYFRELAGQRLLLGGWQRPSEPDAEVPNVHPREIQDKLTAFATQHFPEIDLDTVNRWSGVMGFTPDGIPLLGALPHPPAVYFAVGFGGRGLAWAFVAAERLVNLMLHDHSPGILDATRLTREEETG